MGKIALLDENNVVLELVDELPPDYYGYYGEADSYESCVIGKPLGPLLDESETTKELLAALGGANDTSPRGLRRLLAEIRQVRKAATVIARTVTDDKEASEVSSLLPEMQYDGSLIKAGTFIQWNGGVKKAAVDLWDNEQSTPDNAAALWDDVRYHNGYRIIPEVITATTTFAKGEIGWWAQAELYYESQIDANTSAPGLDERWWKVIKIV